MHIESWLKVMLSWIHETSCSDVVRNDQIMLFAMNIEMSENRVFFLHVRLLHY